jgi:hypothetical protein
LWNICIDLTFLVSRRYGISIISFTFVEFCKRQKEKKGQRRGHSE